MSGNIEYDPVLALEFGEAFADFIRVLQTPGPDDYIRKLNVCEREFPGFVATLARVAELYGRFPEAEQKRQPTLKVEKGGAA